MRTILVVALFGALCASQQTQTTQSTTTSTEQTTQTTTVKTKTKTPKHHKARKQVSSTTTSSTAALPKTTAALQSDIQAKLKSGKLATDPINVLVQGNTITLTGFVTRAQHKGVATREARNVAQRDGWKDFHVDNQLQVQETK
jgi:hypothetical protein